MDIQKLKYFISAAEHLNFTKAAKDCFITQTAMSQLIANMEKELGFQLFVRNNRNMSLTVAGQVFYDQMKILVQSYENSVYHSQQISQGMEGSITICVESKYEGLTFMPRLNYFREHYPLIDITLSVVNPFMMTQNLKLGITDLAICWPYEMQKAEGIIVQSLGDFRSVLACSPNHPLASLQSVSLSDLRTYPLISIDLTSMPYSYQMLFAEWEQMGVPAPSSLNFKQITNMDELILDLEMNQSIALIPEFIKDKNSDYLIYLDLDVKNPPVFRIAEGYLEDNPNPVLPLAIDVLRDNRIPLSY